MGMKSLLGAALNKVTGAVGAVGKQAAPAAKQVVQAAAPIVPGIKQRFSIIAGELVDMAAVEQLETKELVELYRHVLGRASAISNPDAIDLAFPNLREALQQQGGCGEGAADFLIDLLGKRGVAGQVVKDQVPSFPNGEKPLSFFTDHFVIRYRKLDPGVADPHDGVPDADEQIVLPDGAEGWLRADRRGLNAKNTAPGPRYIQKLGVILEHARAQFIRWGFKDPVVPSSPMEVYVHPWLHDQIDGQTAQEWKHIEIRERLDDARLLMVAPHELFHQVQYKYNRRPKSVVVGFKSAVREGGARFIEECLDDSANRYAHDAKYLFPTDAGGGARSFAGGAQAVNRYAVALLWMYMAEQHGTGGPARGIDAYRIVLEETAADKGDYTSAALRRARSRMPSYGTFDQPVFYDAARREPCSHETTWGNFLVAAYLHAAIEGGDRRFDYAEDAEPIAEPWRTHDPGTINPTRLGDLLVSPIDIRPGDALSERQPPWSARYFRFDAARSSAAMLRVSVSAGEGSDTPPLLQILRLGQGSRIVDIHRTDRATYSKVIPLSYEDPETGEARSIESVVVIAGTRDSAGSYSLELSEVPSSPDVMITRWSSRAGTEYEVDPSAWAWTWISPDIALDEGDTAGTKKLSARIRNRGNAQATDISIKFWYQKATAYLDPTAWTLAGAIESPSLDAGATEWLSMDWAPPAGGVQWSIKVEVSVGNDPNDDNKIALSNIARLKAGDPKAVMVVRAGRTPVRHELRVVPRGPASTLTAQLPAALAGAAPAGALPASSALVLPQPSVTHAVPIKIKTLGSLRPADPEERLPQPDAGCYYPVDPATLPPRIDPEHLVTVVHLVDGVAVGGITYSIDPA
jgi:hypothetical protein